MYRHFYIGEKRPQGSLKELTAIIEQALKGSDVYVSEGDDKLAANIGFLLMQKQPVNILMNIFQTRKIPTAIISFDSPLSIDDFFLSLTSIGRDEFLNHFREEADFIGYFAPRVA